MVGPFTTMATWVLLQVNVEINFPLFKCFLLSEFITNDWRRQCSCPGMCAIFRPALLQSSISAAQKIKKLSETPTTVPIVAKLCFINCKNKKMPENGQSDHFQACRQGSPRVAKGFQGPRGTPGMGEMSYNQIDHI